jgi:PIN domain nuclease of toxin-antitoxin system
MRILLDTQVFIWWDSEPEQLSPHLLTLCTDPSNTLILSVASVWEIQIKTQLGKLELNRSLATIVKEHRAKNLLELLPIELTHVLALEQLPFHHKDPFDRIIVAQAISEQLTVLSVDDMLRRYSVTIVDR